MIQKSRILLIGSAGEQRQALVANLADRFEPVVAADLSEAMHHLSTGEFAGVCFLGEDSATPAPVHHLLQNEQVLEGMPDGVVLLDTENNMLWANRRFREWAGPDRKLVGESFYSVLDNPEILGPDFCPFHTALATGTPSSSTLRQDESRYFNVHVAPVLSDGIAQSLIVTVRDVTSEMLQQQKLAAIHQAGIELADLKPEEIAEMSVGERIELLKSNILHYTQDLLHYDVVEIRILNEANKRLEPLLAEGIKPEAAQRKLVAEPENNGVTGFVAATGKSYLCEDTREDPLYLEGAQDARSSLTVPLIFHDEVIGTFNVESPEPRAFSESDLQFLEIFTRDLAVAINTLELLAAQKATSAAESCDAIHSAVALPVDVILNEAVNVMERYIGHEPDVVERLRAILKNARDIKEVIQQVGQKMAPAEALPPGRPTKQRPSMVGKHVLVADEDDSVRSAAHSLMERYGCIVETAHNGDEATYMVRNLGPGNSYDVIIADIRLPDMSGYDFMLKLQTMLDDVPLVLMTGFGYDPGHSIVKARRAGLRAVLYKPFRLDQLLDTVEKMILDHPIGRTSQTQ